MDNTKAHQLVSESIQGQVDRLATDVKALETEGQTYLVVLMNFMG